MTNEEVLKDDTAGEPLLSPESAAIGLVVIAVRNRPAASGTDRRSIRLRHTAEDAGRWAAHSRFALRRATLQVR